MPKFSENVEIQSASLILRDSAGRPIGSMSGTTGDFVIGGNDQDGDLVVRANRGQEAIHLDGATGNVILGGSGLDGDLFVRDKTGQQTIQLDGETGKAILGGNGKDGDVMVKNSAGTTTIHLDGDAGDVKLLGADCAEEFDIFDENEEIEPGSVMVITEDGKLEQCAEANDKRVAGVISGAGDYKPGIVLDRQNSNNGRKPIALNGKVYCKVDAQYGHIAVGDLLTTSLTPGCAMKADDPVKAFGAVIGKALRPLTEGRGLIPILVALQ